MKTLELIKKYITEAAKKFKIRPSEVRPSEFWAVAKDISEWEVRKLGGITGIRKQLFPEHLDDSKQEARVLIFDIETAPILGYVWGLWDNNVALNQIHSDWYVLSWSAKWLGDPANKVMYMDQRDQKDIENDKQVLKGIWKLLDEADVVITQNGKSFDVKKLNARFILQGFQPPSSYRHIDTLRIAKKHFGFTSNKLEYMTKKLCTKYTKLSHAKFSGFELWKQCLSGNQDAWKEMELYNKHDVLSLEELYQKLSPWDNSINLNTYSHSMQHVCSCGSTEHSRNGYKYTNSGKYQRNKCKKCGAESVDKLNLLTKDKRDSLKK